MILFSLLVVVAVAQTFSLPPAAALSAALIGVSVVQVLLFRAFLWVYRPLERVRSFVVLSAAVALMAAIFRVLELGLRRSSVTASEQSTCAPDLDTRTKEREAQLAAVRVIQFLARGVRRVIPQTRKQLFPMMIVSWLILAASVVVVFGITIHSLAASGYPVVGVDGGRGALWQSISASFTIFTTAPIADVAPVSAIGFGLSVVEVLDALFLVGLFVALVIRLVPGDPAQGFERLEKAISDMNEEVEKRLSVVARQISEGREPSAEGDRHVEAVAEEDKA